jgi:hypothetical protein
MNGRTIILPMNGRFPGAAIADCEWRLRTFVERDAYVGYDWAGSHAHPPADSIQESHVSTMNSAMRARSSNTAWANFIGEPLPELDGIPHSLDLIDAPAEQVEPALSALERLTERMAAMQSLMQSLSPGQRQQLDEMCMSARSLMRVRRCAWFARSRATHRIGRFAERPLVPVPGTR